MCLVVLVLLVALGWLLGGGARGQGCTAGWRGAFVSGSSFLGARVLAFVSRLPQVGEAGGGLPVDVVVRASLR